MFLLYGLTSPDGHKSRTYKKLPRPSHPGVTLLLFAYHCYLAVTEAVYWLLSIHSAAKPCSCSLSSTRCFSLASASSIPLNFTTQPSIRSIIPREMATPSSAGLPESRVLIIGTGGTICMQQGPDGLQPSGDFLESAMAPRPTFNDMSTPRGKLLSHIHNMTYMYIYLLIYTLYSFAYIPIVSAPLMTDHSSHLKTPSHLISSLTSHHSTLQLT